MDPENPNNQNNNQTPRYTFGSVDHSILTDFLHGFASTLVAKGAFYPFENLQRLLAARPDYKSFKRRGAYFAGVPEIIKDQGAGAIFRGLVPSTVKYSLFLGSSLALFFEIKYAMFQKGNVVKRDIATSSNIICGLMSSLAVYGLLTPLLETKSKDKSLNGLIDSLKKAQYQTLFKYWKYDIPYILLSQGLLIGMYETKFKKQYYYMRGKVPYFLRFCDAYALALFCGFFAYPFQHGKKSLIEAEAKVKTPETSEAIFRQMAQREGAKAFLKGISNIFLIQLPSAVALTFFYILLEKRKDGVINII